MDNDDAALVDTVAREFIDHQGRDALPRLYEAAELSAEMGDQLSWKAWRDIAEAAERIIRSEQKLSEQTATIPCPQRDGG